MEAMKPLGRVSAITLGDYILKKYGCMSHLKLQKLVYYCDAYHLAHFDTELVPEQFEAWVHGPVCREIYDSIKDGAVLYGDVCYNESSSEDPEELLGSELTTDQLEVISLVLSDLTSWSGPELEGSTHNELPWQEARAGLGPVDKCSKHISKELMRDFYKEEVFG